MAEPCVNSSQSATPKRRWLQFWPVAGYLVACVAGFYAATSEYSWWTGGVTTGMLFGLGCFVSAVGGLSSRCWLRGIWTAVAIAATTVFCFMITESEISEVQPSRIFYHADFRARDFFANAFCSNLLGVEARVLKCGA